MKLHVRLFVSQDKDNATVESDLGLFSCTCRSHRYLKTSFHQGHALVIFIPPTGPESRAASGGGAKVGFPACLAESCVGRQARLNDILSKPGLLHTCQNVIKLEPSASRGVVPHWEVCPNRRGSGDCITVERLGEIERGRDQRDCVCVCMRATGGLTITNLR